MNPVPEVEPDHSLGDFIPSSVDHNFVNQYFLLLCRKVVALYDFDITVVSLAGFCDFDEPSVLFWNAPFGFLELFKSCEWHG